VQDIAVVVDVAVPAEKVHRMIQEPALVARATLFDVYEGPPLPHGKRSLAYSVEFQAADRTLTDAEVADARRRVIRRLEREFGAELRGTA
jgi:phenylalanyl-tRNA synthetase beta chain